MIRIINPGPYSTIQDGGRRGWMRYGVSGCGAMDLLSLAAANLLVGNAPYEGAIEATMLPPSLHFTMDTLFAVTGARCALSLKTAGGTRDIPEDTAVLAHSGDELVCAAATEGCRAYIAFAGGLTLLGALGSVSTDKKAGIGGIGGGAKLERGTCLLNVIPEGARALEGRRLPDGLCTVPPKNGPVTLRCTDGPQANAISPIGKRTLFGAEYAVSPESDRMGIRFLGEAIEHAEGADGNIITDAVRPGAVQIPANGLPILMCADCQTTGGYAKPIWVISADMPLAAQLRPGDTVRFAPVPVKEAEAALREQRGRLGEIG